MRLLVPGSIKEKHPEPEETVSQPSLAGTAKTWPSTSSSLKPESAALGSAVDKPAGRRKSFGLGLRSRRETLHTDTAHMPFSQEEEPPAQHIRAKPNPEPQQGMSPETVPPSLATPDRPSSDKNPLHSVSNLELLCRRDLDSLYDLSDLAGHHSRSPSHASPQAPMEHIDGKEEQRTPVIDFGGQSDSLQPSQQRRVSSAVSPPDDEGSRPGQPAQQPQHPSAGHATSNGSPTAVLEPLDRAAARRLAGTRPRSGSRVTASPHSGSHLGDLLAPRTPELTSGMPLRIKPVRSCHRAACTLWHMQQSPTFLSLAASSVKTSTLVSAQHSIAQAASDFLINSSHTHFLGATCIFCMVV